MAKEEYYKGMYYSETVDYWREYRHFLQNTKVEKLEKTPENIYKYAKENGIKPAARYFDTYPKTIRNYIKKYEEENFN